MALLKPLYDHELGASLSQLPFPRTITREIIPMLRANTDQLYNSESIVAAYPIVKEDHKIKGPGGEITLSVFQPKEFDGNTSSASRLGIYFVHGGGMIIGNRFFGMQIMAEWVVRFNAICVSVEYRLAPEHPDPAPLDDCYAGLQWVGDNLEKLNIDPRKLIVVGQSAGGGLAAGLALMVRDRGGPELCAQVLICPMLDDRNDSTSCKQYPDEGTWSSTSNGVGWSCYLADGKTPSIYAAPGRATDLSGLPQAFIDVGSAEVFRDEDVAYASRLWASGVQAELHVWPGAFHGADALVPSAVLSKAVVDARTAWLSRLLSS